MTKNHRAKQRRRQAAAAAGTSYTALRRQQRAQVSGGPGGQLALPDAVELLALCLTGRGLASVPMSGDIVRVLGGYSLVVEPASDADVAGPGGAPFAVVAYAVNISAEPVLVHRLSAVLSSVADLPLVADELVSATSAWAAKQRLGSGAPARARCSGCGVEAPREHLLDLDLLPDAPDPVPGRGFGTSGGDVFTFIEDLGTGGPVGISSPDLLMWRSLSEIRGEAVCSQCVLDPGQDWGDLDDSLPAVLHSAAMRMLDTPLADPRWAGVVAQMTILDEQREWEACSEINRTDWEMLDGAHADLWGDRWAAAVSAANEPDRRRRYAEDQCRWPFGVDAVRAALRPPASARTREETGESPVPHTVVGSLHALGRRERARMVELVGGLCAHTSLPFHRVPQANYDGGFTPYFTSPATVVPVHLPSAQWLRGQSRRPPNAEALTGLGPISTIAGVVRAIDAGAPGLATTWLADALTMSAHEQIECDPEGRYDRLTPVLFTGEGIDLALLRQILEEAVVFYLGSASTGGAGTESTSTIFERFDADDALWVWEIATGWVKDGWNTFAVVWPMLVVEAVTHVTHHSTGASSTVPVPLTALPEDFDDSVVAVNMFKRLGSPDLVERDLGLFSHMWRLRDWLVAALFPAAVAGGEPTAIASEVCVPLLHPSSLDDPHE